MAAGKGSLCSLGYDSADGSPTHVYYFLNDRLNVFFLSACIYFADVVIDLFVLDKVLLCSPGWSGNYYMDQAGLKLTENLPASASLISDGIKKKSALKCPAAFMF